MHMHTSVVRFSQAFRSQLTHLWVAFPDFSSVSRATGRGLVATLKSSPQVKAHRRSLRPSLIRVRAPRHGCSASKTPTRRSEGRHRRACDWFSPAPTRHHGCCATCRRHRASAASSWPRGLSGRLWVESLVLQLPGSGRPGSCDSAVSAVPYAWRGERAAFGSPKPAQPLL